MGILFMLVTAYIASQYEKAFEFALFYSIVSILIGYGNHLNATAIFVNAAIIFAVCSLHLSILTKLKENQIPWVLTLLAFPAVMLFIAFKVLMIFG